MLFAASLARFGAYKSALFQGTSLKPASIALFFLFGLFGREKNTPRSSAKIKTMLGCCSFDWPWEQRTREKLNRKTKKEYAGPSPKQAKEFVVLDMSKMGRENVWLSWKSKNVKSWSWTLQTSFLGWPCFNCAVSYFFWNDLVRAFSNFSSKLTCHLQTSVFLLTA